MDLNTLTHDDDTIITAGGLADRETCVSADPVLWSDDDTILGCSAPAAVMPRALDHRGDLTDEAVHLTGRPEPAYPVPAVPELAAMR